MQMDVMWTPEGYVYPLVGCGNTLNSAVYKSSEDWASSNSVLAKGLIGYASDTNILKIGDGKSRWDELSGISMILTQNGLASGGFKFEVLTQTEYDNKSHDNQTFYFVK